MARCAFNLINIHGSSNMEELLFSYRCFSSALDIFFIDFNSTLEVTPSVPHVPHLWNKDVKVEDLLDLSVKFYGFWLPLPLSLIGLLFLLFSQFAVICYTWGNPTSLVCFYFVFGIFLTKWAHLFSLTCEMLLSISAVSFIRSVSPPLKRILFSKF